MFETKKDNSGDVAAYKSQYLDNDFQKVDSKKGSDSTTCGSLFTNLIFGCSSVVVFIIFSGFFFDVYLKYQEELGTMQVMINKCNDDYHENMCDRPQGPLPALKESCNQWKECMKRQPSSYVKSSDVFIKLLTEDLNGFSDQILLKSLGIFFMIVFFFSIICACCNKINQVDPNTLMQRNNIDDRYQKSEQQSQQDMQMMILAGRNQHQQLPMGSVVLQQPQYLNAQQQVQQPQYLNAQQQVQLQNQPQNYQNQQQQFGAQQYVPQQYFMGNQISPRGQHVLVNQERQQYVIFGNQMNPNIPNQQDLENCQLKAQDMQERSYVQKAQDPNQTTQTVNAYAKSGINPLEYSNIE